MVDPFTEVGMITQFTAIQCVTEPPQQSHSATGALPPVTSRIWWKRRVGIWTPHNAALPPSCWNIRIYSRCPEPLSLVIQTQWNMTLIQVTGHPYAVHHDACLLRR